MARLRVLVLDATRLYAYWEAPPELPLALRCSDLSGRPDAASLDGKGWRDVSLAPGQTGAYLEDLPPGHILWLELGEAADGGFRPLVAAPPVQLPWEGPVPLPRARPGQVYRS